MNKFRRARLPAGIIVVFALAVVAAASLARAEPPNSVAGVSEEGSFDAAFGRALFAAREAAGASGDKAFIIESISGLRSIDGRLNRLVVRFGLLPALPAALVERASGQVSASLDGLIKSVKPPLELQREANHMADAVASYRIGHVFGLLEEGGVPPLLYATTEAGDVPPIGEGDPGARWVWSGSLAKSDWQSDLDATLADAAEALPAGTAHFAWRAVSWHYRIGGLAGLNDVGLVIEARAAPGELVPAALPGDPATAIEVLRPLIEAHDWPALARHYDLSESNLDPAELLSGAYFYRPTRPFDGDPAGLWRYRHPFHPLARLVDVMVPAAAFRLVPVMMVEIDQGGGPKQRVQTQFWLKETPDGLLVLPD